SASVTGQVVFMGYGIDAPSMGYTAFDEHNVRGKIVVVLAGTPDGLASEERAHFGSMLTKVDTAVRHGAIGVIGIPSNRGNAAAGRTALVRSVSRPREIVAYKNGEKDSIDVVARLTEAGMDKVLTAAKVEASSVFEGEPVTGPWDVTLKMTSKTTYRDYTSPNIIGKIVGADPKLRDEYIVLTAHLDHIGKLSSVERGVDIINNGAMDNAMGTASLIEEARLFMAGETPPQRSLLFIALTAEEKGLLGSEYFVENPTVPVDDMVANVNLDLPLALFEFVDVVAFGAQHSSLKDTAAKAAGKLGVEVIPDPVPEMALFVRSDHYNFVKKGIPSIFLIFGFGNGGEEAFSSYMAADYHRPSDQPDLPIRYDMTAKFAELNYLIAGAIANDAERPRWNEDSVFRDLFAPDQPARPSPTGM
ncbi:MAG: M28 family peptidase, partial [Pseudomonadota bacterium]